MDTSLLIRFLLDDTSRSYILTHTRVSLLRLISHDIVLDPILGLGNECMGVAGRSITS